MKKIMSIGILLLLITVCLTAGCIQTSDPHETETITITDSAGREVVIPADPQRIAVSGSGSTRLVAYLGALDRVVAVDSQDGKTTQTSDLRPYGLANPGLRELPTLGTAKGQIEPERLLAASPDLILKSTSGTDLAGEADELTAKTGIPVVLYSQYDPGTKPDEFAENLRLLGKVLGKEERAEEILKYFDAIREDLASRTKDIPDEGKPMLYVGGVAYSGSHGFYSTQPNYLPFRYLSANNAAAGADTGSGTTENAKVAKEQILAWDPDILFVDLATLTAAGGGSIVELSTDPSYNSMTAVQTGEVYAVLPHTSMGANYETILADAYYIGKVLYPEQFADIDPAAKADEIYEFVVGAPVYDQLNANVNNLSFTKLEIPLL
ncbi:MAG: iron ABC transporter substrate-binding protein [Methanocorpusculum sp.]|nr:iron ABC transporter substrate-binding protein [Methanocorpusculum sp.]MDE2522487.1 iron ABC transporter substrate-binding protein [Methanocorpusculum sp.]MDE2525073.1 iron ABC transporter substrate-binding protein [Methanocorpusculum sp.]